MLSSSGFGGGGLATGRLYVVIRGLEGDAVVGGRSDEDGKGHKIDDYTVYGHTLRVAFIRPTLLQRTL